MPADELKWRNLALKIAARAGASDTPLFDKASIVQRQPQLGALKPPGPCKPRHDAGVSDSGAAACRRIPIGWLLSAWCCSFMMLRLLHGVEWRDDTVDASVPLKQGGTGSSGEALGASWLRAVRGV